MKKLLHDSKYVIASIVVWRLTLYGIAMLSARIFPWQPTFPDSQVLLYSSLPMWFMAFANFDGIHYLFIVWKGYLAVGFVQAFFPVLPLLLKPIWLITQNLTHVVVVGQILSLVSVVLAVLGLRQISTFYHTEGKSNYLTTVLIWLLFPTAFFFAGLYTESLFLALTVGAFLAASRRQWWLAGLIAAVASATRVVGILIVPALLIELGLQTNLWQKETLSSWSKLHHWLLQQKTAVLAICLGSLGLLLYSGYLWYHFHDPLYFFHVQAAFGGGRQESIVLYPQVVWRYLKIITSVPLDIRYLTYIQEFLVGVGGLLVLLVGWKKVRFSLWFFSLTAFIMPTLTGTFLSLPRYILVVPAFFMILSSWLTPRPRLRLLWLTISAFMLILNTILFIQGRWVA